jgi:putative DNA primase/helicase
VEHHTAPTQAPIVAPWINTPPTNREVYQPRGGVFAPSAQKKDYFPENDKGRVTFAVRALARDIVDLGPLASGTDHRIWAYHGGVWRPDDKVITARAAYLMGNRFRRTHVDDAEAIIRALEPTITCDPVPQFVNFQNVLYEWQKGVMHPHTPAVYSTIQLPTNWNPNATCPEFDRFLASVVAPDEIPKVWELIGYLMYSGNPLHKAVMLYGTGRNGKGTFMRVLEKLLGKANTTSVTLQALAKERFAPANLFAKLANIAGDIDPTYLEQTAMFKAVTGQDVITAELKFKPAFDFTPYAVPLFSANKIPGSVDTTEGYFARWLIIEFPYNFSGREDRQLDYRLQQPHEIEGIAVKGLTALDHLMARGNFLESDSGQRANRNFRRRVDQVQSWMDDEDWVLDPHAQRHKRDDLYHAYQSWVTNEGGKQLKASEFYERLRALGCDASKTKGIRYLRGIRQLTEAERCATDDVPLHRHRGRPRRDRGARCPGSPR